MKREVDLAARDVSVADDDLEAAFREADRAHQAGWDAATADLPDDPPGDGPVLRAC